MVLIKNVKFGLSLPQNKTKKKCVKKFTESQKIDIFPKGLTHGFGQKWAIFSTFFFRHYRSGKCLSLYSRTKKRLSRL